MKHVCAHERAAPVALRIGEGTPPSRMNSAAAVEPCATADTPLARSEPKRRPSLRMLAIVMTSTRAKAAQPFPDPTMSVVATPTLGPSGLARTRRNAARVVPPTDRLVVEVRARHWPTDDRVRWLDSNAEALVGFDLQTGVLMAIWQRSLWCMPEPSCSPQYRATVHGTAGDLGNHHAADICVFCILLGSAVCRHPWPERALQIHICVVARASSEACGTVDCVSGPFSRWQESCSS
jgi:hypothetical protein